MQSLSTSIYSVSRWPGVFYYVRFIPYPLDLVTDNVVSRHSSFLVNQWCDHLEEAILIFCVTLMRYFLLFIILPKPNCGLLSSSNLVTLVTLWNKSDKDTYTCGKRGVEKPLVVFQVIWVRRAPEMELSWLQA